MPEDTHTDIVFEFGRLDLIDQAEPLWLSLFDHHRAVGKSGLPIIDRGDSWPLRRQYYATILDGPDAFVLLARRDGRPIGYAVAHIHEGADDTWPTGDRIGEIDTLAVLPGERGNGLGTQLLDRAEERLASVGARSILIVVLHGNDDARRFYERRQMAPIATVLMRLPAAAAT
jgi:ribosomal protein S18 acetylase RimI-like enzyme